MLLEVYPIERTQLDSLTVAGGFSPGSEHRAMSFGEFSEHVNSFEEFKVDSAAIGNSSHFFVILFVGVGKSDLVVEVKDGP